MLLIHFYSKSLNHQLPFLFYFIYYLLNNYILRYSRSPAQTPNTSQSLNPTTSPSQSIISLSSNSSILEDQSRSQTPTNLDQLNTNANHIITNISKLFQNDTLQPLQRPPNSSSNSSTISMETTPIINPIMSNSQLARGLSAPSPTRHETMTISPNHLMKQNSSSSLNSIPSILDNVDLSRVAVSPVSANKFASNSKSGPQSPMQPKKLAMEQRVNPSVKASPMQQRPNEHSLVHNSSNKISNVNKFPYKRTEYVTKEKALMVSEEIKSMQSNPNTNMTILEQNYKARNMPSAVQRPNIVQNFNQNNKMQPQTNRSSFDNEQMNQVIKNTQQQMLNKQQMPHLNKQINNNLATNKPIQPQRPFDSTRPTSSNDHLKQRNLLQDQRTFAPNIPSNQKATNLNQSKQMTPQLQQQHHQQQKQPVPNQFYNQKHATSPPVSISPSGLASKQAQTSRVNPIQPTQSNLHQQQEQQFNQLNYAKQSNGSAPQTSQHSQLNRGIPYNATQPGHYYPPQQQHIQIQQQVRHQQQQQHAHQH